jgi:hypothetical protein
MFGQAKDNFKKFSREFVDTYINSEVEDHCFHIVPNVLVQMYLSTALIGDIARVVADCIPNQFQHQCLVILQCSFPDLLCEVSLTLALTRLVATHYMILKKVPEPMLLDCAEFFAGCGVIAGSMAEKGLKTCKFDVCMSEEFDVLSPHGFLFHMFAVREG